MRIDGKLTPYGRSLSRSFPYKGDEGREQPTSDYSVHVSLSFEGSVTPLTRFLAVKGSFCLQTNGQSVYIEGLEGELYQAPSGGALHSLTFSVSAAGELSVFADGVLITSAPESLEGCTVLEVDDVHVPENLSLYTFEIYNEAKDAAWALLRYAALYPVLISGPYVEQEIFDSGKPVSYDTLPYFESCPMVMCQTGDGGDWVLLDFADYWDAGTNEQRSFFVPQGATKLRMYAKQSVQTRGVIYDNLVMDSHIAGMVSLPRSERDRFIKIVMQAKPVKCWAALLINWV